MAHCNDAAVQQLISLRAECMRLLQGITEHVDSHFDVVPDEVNYGHVGDASHIKTQLQDIYDRIHGEGEYAA